MDVTRDGSKAQCCKEQYCIGIWNVRSRKQGKLEVVKQEMARVNINILGISELKRTGMGEFNSDDNYIYYCGKAWSSACLSRCPRGERALVQLYLKPGVFSERCTEKLPLRVDCIHRLEYGEVSGHRVLIKRGPGNRGPTECGTTHEATSGMSS